MARPRWVAPAARKLAEQIIEECVGPLDPRDEDAVTDAMVVILTEALINAEQRGIQKRRK
jgi:hypothetical protein